MKKLFSVLVIALFALNAFAQEEQHLFIHSNHTVIYDKPVSGIEDIRFQGRPASAIFNLTDGQQSFPISMIDSITFGIAPEPPQGDIVVITYNGNAVEIVNPFSNEGVTVSSNQADVTVNSTRANVGYQIAGSSSNGSLCINSNNDLSLYLDNLNLTSNSKAAIDIATNVNVALQILGSSTLADGANGSQNGAFHAVGNVNLTKSPALLSVTGNAKHGVSVEGTFTVSESNLQINDSDSDGIHATAMNVTNGSSITILNTGSDGIDCSGDINITGGDININAAAEDVKGIKATGNLLVAGGNISINVTGYDTKAMVGNTSLNVTGGNINITTSAEEDKCFTSNQQITLSGGTITMHINGNYSNGISADHNVTIKDNADITIVTAATDGKAVKAGDPDNSILGDIDIQGGELNITTSGDISKGIKCNGTLTIDGGSIDIIASGGTIVENINNQNVPSYCTAIKCDGNMVVNNGDITINLPTSNNGGKAISADGDITINGGTFGIETHGDGASYTISGTTKDAYTSSCIKCEGNLQIRAGNLTCVSTGKGGKGINTDGTLTIGTSGSDNRDLVLNVTTSGERITVSSGGGGGGGWPPGGGGDYANPKGIKSQGNMTINSGTISVNCTQSQNEGGECIESKATLTINGGNIEAVSVKDDAVNAANNITLNGGSLYAHSDGNDGVDSNGTLFVNGGFHISNGARQPEEGFDCDNNQFKVTGSTMIGTGGATSNPTSNVCTQPTLKINTQAERAIQILKTDGTVIATFQCPAFTGGGGGGGGWPPGGGSGMVMLFSDPQLSTGNSYIVKYGGTISGGTNNHGYYTGDVTYSGGQQTTVNVNSMLTTVNASN
ncbi:MAG: carbohydrate-binding domain-containing protein [Bacteroidales bacterium]|nr:carbohydrate-binding domain-containing protein [Bacteroidales bacterium]